jgi:galactose mutarotase-like enzyme
MNHTLSNDSISASVSAAGAELISLKNAQGLELLWQAGPVWPRHAPILFPIVGRLKNDELQHQGKLYPMTQHGFARDRKALGGHERMLNVEERLKAGYRAVNPETDEGRPGSPWMSLDP